MAIVHSRHKGKSQAARKQGLFRISRISKTLTLILRHKAVDLGIRIRTDGYCSLKEVLLLPWLSALLCTQTDVLKPMINSAFK